MGKAFRTGWAVTKQGWPYNSANDPRLGMGDQESWDHDEAVVVPMAAKLFLETTMSLLEQGQEDYVAESLAQEGYGSVHPIIIEKGRAMAIEKLSAFLRGA